MSKKSMSFVIVVTVIASFLMVAYSPSTALAAGNGNGNGTEQGGNGTPAQNQDCNGTCSGVPTETNTSTGPGPFAQTNTSTGPGNPAETGAGFGAGNGAGQGTQVGAGQRYGAAANQGSGIALGPLSEAEADALVEAIEEEYGAQALYQYVLSVFGDVAPFNNIVLSEGQHINALTSMAAKYGVSVPNFKPGNMPEFTTLAEACQAGVAAEKADADLYDTLIAVTTHADLLQVYHNLQSASLNQHLPAFEACQ